MFLIIVNLVPSLNLILPSATCAKTYYMSYFEEDSTFSSLMLHYISKQHSMLLTSNMTLHSASKFGIHILQSTPFIYVK